MPRKRTRRTSPTPSPPPKKTRNDPDANASDTTSNISENQPQTPLSPTDEEMPEEDIQHSTSTSTSIPGSAGPGPARYNALKSHDGQIYSGMAVGGTHTWTYDPGTWTETKEEPDLWKIDYRSDKRRNRKAPRGSGAPVGTEYHWLIVGHQMVKKTDANTYETHLTGSKYKLAYKSANSNSWSVPTVKKQRDREVELLEDAKRRVMGRPPVLASERVRVAPREPEKGQQKLDALFGVKGGRETGVDGVGDD